MASMACFAILLAVQWIGLGSAELTDCKDFPVQPVDQLPPEYQENLNKDYYKKFVFAAGIPILGSDAISDIALREAARIIGAVTGTLRPGFLDVMTKGKQRVVLWSKNGTSCEIPESQNKECTPVEEPLGLAWGNIYIFKEPDVMCGEDGDSNFGYNLIAGFIHSIHGAFNQVNETLQKDLDAALENAKAKNLWEGDIFDTLSDHAQYFAIGTAAWFEAFHKDHCDNMPCNKDALKRKDPSLYDSVASTFQSPDWVNECANQAQGDAPAGALPGAAPPAPANPQAGPPQANPLQMLAWACKAALQWYQAQGSHAWVYKCSEACSA